MAYPFIPFPTLQEFTDRVKSQYGVEIKSLDGKGRGPRGPVDIKLFFKEPNKFATIPDIKDTEPLYPDVLRSLCRQLGIPPEDFGLILD